MPALVPPPYRTPGPLTADQMYTLTRRSAVKAYVSLVPMNALVATARVASQTFTDTLTNIAIESQSSNWSSIFDGATVSIGTTAGAEDVGIYRIRANDNVNILKIGETGAGDPGLVPLMKLNSISVGNYVTVHLIDRNVSAAFTRISYDGLTATFYKDYDKLYTGQNQLPPPDLRMGTHLATFVTPGFNTARVQFVLGAKTWASQPLDTYTYLLPSGCSIVSGDAVGSCGSFLGDGPVSATTLTVDMPVGFHVVRAFITTQGSGYITNGFRFIWVHDGVGPGATFPPYVIPNWRLYKDRVGWDISTTLLGTDISEIRQYGVAHFWKIAYWDDQEQLTAGRSSLANTQYTGWLTKVEPAPGENGTREANVEISSVTRMLDRLPTSSLVLDVAVTPADWNHCVQGFCNAEFWSKYVLDNHAPNASGLFDKNYFSTETDVLYQQVGLSCPSGSLLNGIQNVARRANLNFGVDSNGRFWLRPHPSMISYNNRTTDKIPVRMTLTPDHYKGAPRWSLAPFMTTRHVDGAGFWYDSSKVLFSERPQPVRAEAFSATPSQGVATETMNDLLVQDQLDLNFRTGARAAVINNPTGNITVELPGHYDVIDPPQMYFVNVYIPDKLNPLNASHTWRTIPLTFTETGDSATGVVDTTLVLEPEAAGQPGTTVPIGPRVIKPPPPPPPPPKPPGWSRKFKFFLDPYTGIWAATFTGGTWTAGIGWHRDSFVLRLDAFYELDEPNISTVTYMRATVASTYPTPETTDTWLRVQGVSDTSYHEAFPAPSGTVDFTTKITFDFPTGQPLNTSGNIFFQIIALASESNPMLPSGTVIREIDIGGTGADPHFVGEV